jgi:hypothetical protein
MLADCRLRSPILSGPGLLRIAVQVFPMGSTHVSKANGDLIPSHRAQLGDNRWGKTQPSGERGREETENFGGGRVTLNL